MKRLLALVAAVGLVATVSTVLPAARAGQAAPPPAAADLTNQPFWTGITNLASFERESARHLGHAQSQLDQLLKVNGRRTIDNTLRPYDAIAAELNLAEAGSNVVYRLHAEPAFREAGTAILAKVTEFQNGIMLNRGVYDALRAIDLTGADDETRHYVTRELQMLRLAGADRDEATRARLRDLRQQHETFSADFRKNFNEGATKVPVTRAELDGVPADFVAALKPDASGALHLVSGEADARPVLTFAKSDELRRRMYVAYNRVGYPANEAVIKRMLSTRAEIARLTGHANWAEWDMVPRMAQTRDGASRFMDRLVAASGPKAASDYAALLKRKQQDDPGAKAVNVWESTYYTELVRRERYAFDSQKMREYFPFERVKKGVLDVGTTLFGVTYRPVAGVPVWHSSVEVYELLDNGRVIGRFYLDLNRRTGKPTNALATLIRKGMAGQLTEIALMTSYRSPTAEDPALMSPDEVKQFFHEFGHVIQNILASQHKWFGTSGTPTERDFNEGPSQLLEEWVTDAKTLATFALHYKTNAPVPADQVDLMRRAAEFGQGLFVRTQTAFARYTLEVHEHDPQTVDPGAVMQRIQREYVPYTFTNETHLEARFTQFANPNYSASYYTYMWSLVIAKDLFSRFDRANLMAPDIARRYRDTVIVPGASKPAGALIQDFLGRPFNYAAWEAWLNAGG